METVAQPRDAELHLLTEWGDAGARARGRKAAILSVLAHVAVIVTVVAMPPEVLKGPEQNVMRRVTPLIEPPTQLTQKAPNTTKPGKEFRAEVRPRLQLPAGPPPEPAPRQTVAPPPPPKRQAAATLPDAPAVQASKELPKPDMPILPPSAAPPQIQAGEKQTPFENPSAFPQPGSGRMRGPDTSVAEAIRQTVRGGGSGRTLVPGEPDGAGQGLPGSAGELPQLLSDPMGVDFRPYLTQILTIVRRNWFAVMPESVKLGQSGKVAVQFAVVRTGTVTKVVYAAQSGNRALDQAAVAAISMSNPFPALPVEFKGDRIVLQFNFAYNQRK